MSGFQLTVYAQQTEELALVHHERQLVDRSELVGLVDFGQIIHHDRVIFGALALDDALDSTLLAMQLLIVQHLGHLPAVAARLRQEAATCSEGRTGRKCPADLGSQRATLYDDQDEPEQTGVEDQHRQLHVDAEPAGPEEGPLVEALVLAHLFATSLWPENAQFVINKWRVDVATQKFKNLR